MLLQLFFAKLNTPKKYRPQDQRSGIYMQKEPVFKKILVPVDDSIPSLVAQELTVFIAKKFNSKVTVFHVVSHEFMNPQLQKLFPERHEHYPIGASTGAPTTYRHVSEPPTYLPEAVSEEINNVYHEKGKEAIESAVVLFREEGIPVDEKLVQHADPAETIINESEKGNYDLVIMGRSGEEEKEPHLGSVAKKVTMHTNVPVLIAREKRHISKILVPIDGSKSAEKALHHATLLAKKPTRK